jgi:hypothetical protein
MAQVPLVAVFIWFTLTILSRFLAFIKEQRQDFLCALKDANDQNRALERAIGKLTDEIRSIDQREKTKRRDDHRNQPGVN